MDKNKPIDPDVDAPVKRILALKPDSRTRVTAELKAMDAKGPKSAKKK